MSLFAWANRQLEQLTDKLAPVPNDPAHRFSKACSSNDGQFALQLLSSMPPPLPDGTHSSPLDPFGTIINKQKGSFAIHCAAEYAQINVVKALIAQFGVSPEQFDQQGNTPLHYAAASQCPQALELVKMLIKEYNVSATVQNMHGKTPYDLANIDSVRQYLLPIQLQSETQKCIDNGGRGLPEGIDMGGLVIKKDIPPPPIVSGGFGSPIAAGGTGNGGNMHIFSAANMKSASKYAVPVFGQQQQQGPGEIMDATATALPAVQNSLQSPTNISFNHATKGVQSIVPPTVGIMNPTSDTKILSPPPVVEPNASLLSPAVDQARENPNAQLAESEEKSPVIHDQSGVASSGNAQVPVENFNDASTTHPKPTTGTSENSSRSATPWTTPNLNQTTVENSTGRQHQVEMDSAPSSGSGYARRGYSSAAVLPTNAKYKPDGFHSSSSDVSLQKKYGHDPSISGPPSGSFRTSMIAPPPSASVSAVASGSNPYAARSAYGVSPAMARPRYPTYDAISDTVGAAPGGHTGYNYNPYAMSHMPGAHFNMYNPGATTQHQNFMQPTANSENNYPMVSSTPWKTATSPDGRIYYYNEITNESTWEMPSDMLQQQAQSMNSAANHADSVQSSEPPINNGKSVDAQPEIHTEPTSMTEKDIAKPVSSKATENVETCNPSAQVFFGVSPPEGSASESDQPSKDVSGNSTQSLFGTVDDSGSNVNVATVNDELKNLNLSLSTGQQNSATPATAFFENLSTNTPIVASESAYITNQIPLQSELPAELISPEELNTTQKTLEEDEANVSQDDDVLPQPPFVVDESNEDDDFVDDDLPPPPMIDISLS